MHALMHWLLEDSKAELKDILWVFPVRGHSFLPADRVFGRVERELSKHPTILSNFDYVKLYERFGAVKELGKDWKLKDVKELSNHYQKLDHMSELKKITMQKFVVGLKVVVKVKSSKFYRFEEADNEFHSLLKRGKKGLRKLNENIPLHHEISAEKKKDVASLLSKLYGDSWRDDANLAWYNDIVSTIPVTVDGGSGDDDDGSDALCDCTEHDTSVMHV
jgi:hypothetical protein